MREDLGQYLTDSYRHDILGESVRVEMPQPSPELIKDIEAAIARIDALGLGQYLAQRAFMYYQHRRALVSLLKQVKAQSEG